MEKWPVARSHAELQLLHKAVSKLKTVFLKPKITRKYGKHIESTFKILMSLYWYIYKITTSETYYNVFKQWQLHNTWKSVPLYSSLWSKKMRESFVNIMPSWLPLIQSNIWGILCNIKKTCSCKHLIEHAFPSPIKFRLALWIPSTNRDWPLVFHFSEEQKCCVWCHCQVKSCDKSVQKELTESLKRKLKLPGIWGLLLDIRQY